MQYDLNIRCSSAKYISVMYRIDMYRLVKNVTRLGRVKRKSTFELILVPLLTSTFVPRNELHSPWSLLALTIIHVLTELTECTHAYIYIYIYMLRITCVTCIRCTHMSLTFCINKVYSILYTCPNLTQPSGPVFHISPYI